MEKLKGLVPPQRLRLDWRAYWESFKAKHSKDGEPIPFGDRILFPDGWMYAYDYRGPEWPPDHRELQLRRLYQLVKRREVRIQMRAVAAALDSLRQLQTVKDAPLMRSEFYIDDDGKPARRSLPVDLDELTARLRWLETELIKVGDALCRLTEGSSAAT